MCYITTEEILEQMRKMRLRAPEVTCEDYGTREEQEPPRDEENKEEDAESTTSDKIPRNIMLDVILEQIKKMGLKVPV